MQSKVRYEGPERGSHARKARSSPRYEGLVREVWNQDGQDFGQCITLKVLKEVLKGEGDVQLFWIITAFQKGEGDMSLFLLDL